MTKNEKYEFLKENWGKECQFSDTKDFKDYKTNHLVGVDTGNIYNFPFMAKGGFNYKYCRLKPKKERYLTPQELLGKTITDGEHTVIITSIDDDHVCFSCSRYSNPLHDVESLHRDGWTLEDGSPLLVEDNEGGEV